MTTYRSSNENRRWWICANCHNVLIGYVSESTLTCGVCCARTFIPERSTSSVVATCPNLSGEAGPPPMPSRSAPAVYSRGGEAGDEDRLKRAFVEWQHLAHTCPDAIEFTQSTCLLSDWVDGAQPERAEALWHVAFDLCHAPRSRARFLLGIALFAVKNRASIPQWVAAELQADHLSSEPVAIIARALVASLNSEWGQIEASNVQELPVSLEIRALATLMRANAMERLGAGEAALRLLEAEVSHWGLQMLSCLGAYRAQLPALRLCANVWPALMRQRGEAHDARSGLIGGVLVFVIALAGCAFLVFKMEPAIQVGPGEWVVETVSWRTTFICLLVVVVSGALFWMYRRLTRERRRRMRGMGSFVLGRVLKISGPGTDDDGPDYVTVVIATGSKPVDLRIHRQERWPFQEHSNVLLRLLRPGNAEVA